MYLSRLLLNPRSRQVRSELARPYEMHRTLLRAFPNGKVHTGRTEEDASGLLFRVEEDARTGRLLKTLEGHDDAVNFVTFSPDDRWLLTSSADKTARLWDVATGQEVRRFEGHTQQLGGIAFSPDSRYILTTSTDGTAKLWDAQSGAEVKRFVNPTEVYSAPPWMESADFSRDGRYLLLGGTRLLEVVNGAAPVYDAFVATLSLTAQWLLNRRYVESWLCWIVVDQVSVVLFWSRDMHLTAGLYAVFLVMCVAGLFEWRRSLNEVPR